MADDNNSALIRKRASSGSSSSDDEEEDGGCFFNPDMFTACVEEENQTFSFSFERGNNETRPIDVELLCIHGENELIERFVPRVVWPSAEALSHIFAAGGTDANSDPLDYLARANASRGLCGAELGSGTGLCTIVLCSVLALLQKDGSNATFLLTDGNDESVDIIRRNLQANGLSGNYSSSSSPGKPQRAKVNCSVHKLWWGVDEQVDDLLRDHSLQYGLDFVIGTDVVYEPKAVGPLVASAHRLLRPNGIFILANHEHRYAGLRDAMRQAVADAAFSTLVDTKIGDDGKVDLLVFRK